MVALRNLCVENWFEQNNTQTHPLIQRWWQRKPFISRCCCYFFLVSRTHPRVRWHVNRFDYNGHSNWFNCPFHSIIAFIRCSVFLLWFVAVKWEREKEKNRIVLIHKHRHASCETNKKREPVCWAVTPFLLRRLLRILFLWYFLLSDSWNERFTKCMILELKQSICTWWKPAETKTLFQWWV